MGEDSVLVLITGAAANLARLRLLQRRNLLLGKRGSCRVSTYPGRDRFNFGDGRPSDVRFPADIPLGTACCRRKFAALVPEADIPA